MVITGDIAPSFLFTLLVLLSQQQAELALEATLYDAQGAALARAEERETTTMDRGGEVLAELIARAVDALLPEPSAQAAAGGHTPFGASQP